MLRKIFNLCHSIELAAEAAYLKISGQTENNEQKSFWLDVAQDEKRHAAYWKQLLELQKKGSFRNPFDNPWLVVDELNTVKGNIEEIVDNEHLNSDLADLILWAYRLEHNMLHPAFAIFYHALAAESVDISPEEDYQKHINKFAQMVKKHLNDKPELNLVGEILSSIWQRNRELANQFYQIKTLRGLIPICANCKQVRNDEGYWEKIEAYIERYSATTFTHSICPECAKKLYPGITKDSL